MRLVSLEASGFRGFPSRVTFDLNADAVVVVASNGVGKTTMLDAILWGLSGSVPRLGEGPEHLISLRPGTGQMHVGIDLRSGSAPGGEVRVDRMYDGDSVKLSVREAGRFLRDEQAALRLYELMNADEVGGSEGDLAQWVSRTVYLQQDQISDFVRADSESERFEAAAAVLGLSELADFQNALDRARTAWSKSTNQIDRELIPLRRAVDSLEQEVGSLSTAIPPEEERATIDASRWADALSETFPEATSIGGEDPLEIEVWLQTIAQNQRLITNRLEQKHGLTAKYSSVVGGTSTTDVEQLAAALLYKEQLLSDAQAALTEAETIAQAEHLAVLASQRKLTEIQALAELALRHLGESCPVCDQGIDQSNVAERLHALMESESLDISESGAEVLARERSETVAMLTAECTSIREQLRSAEAEQGRRVLLVRELERDAAALAVEVRDGEDLAPELTRSIDADQRAVDQLQALRASGENILQALTSRGSQERLFDAQRRLNEQRQSLLAKENALRQRVLTGESASTALEHVREQTDALVANRLQQLVPLAQRIYSAIDPHPEFRVIQLVSAIKHRRGRLHPSIEDPVSGMSSNDPYLVLSNSQTNALALSFFLGMNLGARNLPLQACLLDDPLQNLDEVHLLGLVDVLRRLKQHRQLVITTHDKTFASLLARKLRPTGTGRTVVIRLGERIDDAGLPSPTHEDVPLDSVPLKFVG